MVNFIISWFKRYLVSENLPKSKGMNQEYYSSTFKTQNNNSIKSPIPIKSDKRSREIEIKLNMKAKDKPTKRKNRCYSTNSISDIAK